jgi:hypothetical protein
VFINKDSSTPRNRNAHLTPSDVVTWSLRMSACMHFFLRPSCCAVRLLESVGVCWCPKVPVLPCQYFLSTDLRDSNPGCSQDLYTAQIGQWLKKKPKTFIVEIAHCSSWSCLCGQTQHIIDNTPTL